MSWYNRRMLIHKFDMIFRETYRKIQPSDSYRTHFFLYPRKRSFLTMRILRFLDMECSFKEIIEFVSEILFHSILFLSVRTFSEHPSVSFEDLYYMRKKNWNFYILLKYNKYERNKYRHGEIAVIVIEKLDA